MEHERERWMSVKVPDVLHPSGRQVVDRRHTPPIAQESVGEVRTDEACSPSDDDVADRFHGGLLPRMCWLTPRRLSCGFWTSASDWPTSRHFDRLGSSRTSESALSGANTCAATCGRCLAVGDLGLGSSELTEYQADLDQTTHLKRLTRRRLRAHLQPEQSMLWHAEPHRIPQASRRWGVPVRGPSNMGILVTSQVIPEGTGSCQGLGDFRLGLSWTAAHTSR